jgi:hypothetical protein
MVPGSVKIYTRLTSLNPQHVTTYINSVSAIRENVIHVSYWAKDTNMLRKDHRTR